MALMRDYIAFAKEHVQPTISEAAQQRLIDAYVDMRYTNMKKFTELNFISHHC